MTDLVNIGSAAVDIYRKALATTSNNIANLNTEGYSRQEVSIGQAVTREVGGLTFGTGAKLEGIRRLFDGFVEVSLRASISNLQTQTPMVTYATRALDVMGDRIAGLSPVMDNFFANALELAQDPASRILRDRFLRGADDLARRFGELSGQFDILGRETRSQITEKVDTLNILGQQMAKVNQELNRKLVLDKQPLALLDERDLILRKMSEVARINVIEAPNGMVSVSLTDSTLGLFVQGVTSSEVGVLFDDTNPAKVDIVLDPRGNNRRVVGGLQSGAIGGLMTFREQVLQPVQDSLDFLALAMAREINAVHRSGVDFNGNAGKDLFAIDPVFTVLSPAQRLNVRVDVEVVEPRDVRFRDLEFTFDDNRKVWIAVDSATGQRVLSDPVTGSVGRVNINGLEVRISGTPANAENFVLKAENRPATGLRLAIDEPFEVAAADLFRSIRSEDNLSRADARVSYDPLSMPRDSALPLDQVFRNSQAETRQFDPTRGLIVDSETNPDSPLRAALVSVIPAGYRDIDLFLAGAAESGLQIQLLTRDGRHLLGGGNLEALLKPENAVLDLGFERGAQYSDAYLNRSDTSPYRDIQLFYGVRAQPVLTGRYNAIDPAVTPLANGQILPAGALVINGKSLGALSVEPNSTEIDASQVANWINANRVPGVTASAVNEIRVPATQFDPDGSLTLNGVPIDFGDLSPSVIGGKLNLSPYVAEINARRDLTGVEARLNLDGSILVRSIDGRNIDLGPADNALGLRAGLITGRLELSSLDFIDIGFGTDGQNGIDTADTLRRLGIDIAPAVVASNPVPAVTPIGGVIFGAGAIRVNDVPMAALTPAGDALEASDVAAWFNAADIPGVTATARTTITIPRAQLNLASGLTIVHGAPAQTTPIPEEGGAGNGWTSIQSLINSINGAGIAGVLARQSSDGSLVLEQLQGNTLRVTGSGTGNVNALGVPNDSVFRGSYVIESALGPLRMTLGDNGNASDLANLGLRANAHVDGVLSEDLLVFVTGTGSGSLSAEYAVGEINRVEQLRANPLSVIFDAEDRYRIVDTRTQTVVAERQFQFGENNIIAFRGLQIELTARPRAGDRFRIDGNVDGIGNNANIRRLAELQESRVLAGGLTFADSYQQTVSIVGNQARQATLARDAFGVVNQQALEARDSVSGVSLDEEAANLVRFQQAFQAAARIIQTANQIFDAILAIR